MATLQELLHQQQVLNQQIEDARRTEQAEVIASIRSRVQQYNFTVRDVFPNVKRPVRVLGKVAAKYHDPDTGKTWSGRGKAPKWLEGKDRSQFAI